MASSYEKYNLTHKNYDRTRLAVGHADTVARLHAHRGHLADLPDLKIIDLGCGTGLQLAAMMAAGMGTSARGEICGLDSSETGLEETRKKLSCYKSKNDPRLINGDMRQVDGATGRFDLVFSSFAMHHLPRQAPGQLLDETRLVLGEAERLLARDGLLAIVTCTPEQMSADLGSMWYYRYFPRAAHLLAQRFIGISDWQHLLAECGFATVEISPVTDVYYTAAGIDLAGPFTEEFQAGDSIFALAKSIPGELDEGLAALSTDIASGAAALYLNEVMQRNETHKQAILITASR